MNTFSSDTLCCTQPVSIKSESSVLIAGHNRFIHTRHPVFRHDDFSALAARLKTQTPIVAVTRYNVFLLDKLSSFINEHTAFVSLPAFSPFPLSDIHSRFCTYITRCKELLNTFDLQISDDALNAIFMHIQSFYTPESNDMLRFAMGPVFEQAFRGPDRVLIDLTTLCNTDCEFCRAHSPLVKSRIPPRNFSVDLPALFESFANTEVKNISLVGSGDPSLFPHLKTLLMLAHRYNIAVDLSTNGILLSEYSDTFLEYPPASITVSLNGGTPESYAQIHTKTADAFSDIVNACTHLATEKRRRNQEKPGLIMLHCINKKTFRDIPAMVELAHECGFETVWLQMLHAEDFSQHLRIDPDLFSELNHLIEQGKKAAEKYGLLFETYIDYQLKNITESGKWSPSLSEQGCLVGWYFTYLCLGTWMNFCCGLRPVVKLNNGQDFKTLWFSETYDYFRAMAKSLSESANISCEIPSWQYAKRYLFDDFCASCDNHNFNALMYSYLEKTGLIQWCEKIPASDASLSVSAPDTYIPGEPLALHSEFKADFPGMQFFIAADFFYGPFLVNSIRSPLFTQKEQCDIHISAFNYQKEKIRLKLSLMTHENGVDRIIASTHSMMKIDPRFHSRYRGHSFEKSFWNISYTPIHHIRNETHCSFSSKNHPESSADILFSFCKPAHFNNFTVEYMFLHMPSGKIIAHCECQSFQESGICRAHVQIHIEKINILPAEYELRVKAVADDTVIARSRPVQIVITDTTDAQGIAYFPVLFNMS